MRKAINAWTIPANVSFEEMFLSISSAGFEAIELNVDKEEHSKHSLSMKSSSANYHEIIQLSEKYHLPVCSISTSLYGGLLGSPDEKERKKGQDILRKQLECAAALGADGILVVPGGINDTTSIIDAYKWSKQSIQELIPEIENAKIKVGLENVWNGFFASPMDMVRFIDDFDCPYIGAYYDVGNVLINSYPEYWIEILNKRIMKIHIKDFYHSGWNQGVFVNLLQGSARWAHIMKALQNAGYDDVITAELSDLPNTPDYLYRITSDAMNVIMNMK